jgi:integrase
MTYVRVKGFKIFADRHGKVRCYHRATGTAVDLEKHPIGSAGFIAECDRITRLADKGMTAKPGTLGLLITEYRKHHAFQDLADRTKADYQRVFDYLQPIADTALVRFDSPMVARIRDKAGESKGRRFGSYVRTVLSLLFAWGKERGYVKINPAEGLKGIRKPKDAPEANRPWRDHERHAVMEALPAHMKPAMALMMYCGLDPQDALSLPRSAIKGDMIDTKRGKTKEPVWLPLPSPIANVIAAAPDHDAVTVCANSYGRPWTVSGYRASWRRVRIPLEQAGKVQPYLTLKGLRHTVATILSEMGKGPEDIRLYLGQKTDAMAKHYSRRADHTERNTETTIDFVAEVNRRATKVVKPT